MKKVIFLPKADNTPPSDMRILTTKQAEEVLKDKTKTWREFIPPLKSKEGDISLSTDFAPNSGIAIFTQMGNGVIRLREVIENK